MKKIQKFMNKKGFSLVELIIVIAIMAALVAVLAPQYLKYVQKSRVNADKTQIDEITRAISIAAADEDCTVKPPINVKLAIANGKGTLTAEVKSGATNNPAVGDILSKYVTESLGSLSGIDFKYLPDTTTDYVWEVTENYNVKEPSITWPS